MRRQTRARFGGALAIMIPIGAMAATATAGPGATASTSIVQGRAVVTPANLTSVRHDDVSSTNWSGYAVQSPSAFTNVVGTWVQPAVTCSSLLQNSYSAFWVGLDGYVSTSVEQLGTEANCTRTTASYSAWWEMYPASSVSLSTSTYPVRPGDTLTAEVARTGSSYTLSLKSSRGWTFTITETGSDANASAEWVAEAPEICTVSLCRQSNLADFGTVTFNGSEAATGGGAQPISSFTADGGPHDVTMASSLGTTKAQPTALTAAGTGFSDTWHHA